MAAGLFSERLRVMRRVDSLVARSVLRIFSFGSQTGADK